MKKIPKKISKAKQKIIEDDIDDSLEELIARIAKDHKITPAQAASGVFLSLSHGIRGCFGTELLLSLFGLVAKI